MITRKLIPIAPQADDVNRRPNAAEIDARHKESLRDEKRRKRRLSKSGKATKRINELGKVWRHRYGYVLPDNGEGRNWLLVLAHHMINRAAVDLVKQIVLYAELSAPWLKLAQAEEIAAEVQEKPIWWNADQLAWRVGLKDVERTALNITSIGAVDCSKAERARRRKNKSKDRSERHRRAAGAKPRSISLAKTKPWKKIGMSRSAWYAAGKPNGPPVKSGKSGRKRTQHTSSIGAYKAVQKSEAPGNDHIVWSGQVFSITAERMEYLRKTYKCIEPDLFEGHIAVCDAYIAANPSHRPEQNDYRLAKWLDKENVAAAERKEKAGYGTDWF